MQTALLSHGRTPQIEMTGVENKCDENDLQFTIACERIQHVIFSLLIVGTTKENATATKFCTFGKCMQTQKYI